MTATIQHDDRPRAGLEVVHEMIRAFKVRRLYDPGHPQRRESEEHSGARIAALLEDSGAIDFVLESERLLVEGMPVHEQPEGRDSLVFLLYREGVRQLSLYPGLTGDELGFFLDEVAAAALAGAEDEFDLVARLWGRNFTHIRYAFVEQLLDQDWVPAAREQSLILGRDDEVVVLLDEDKSAAEFLREVDPTIYFLDDEDMAALQREIESEKDRTLHYETLTCLLEVLWAMGSEDPAPILDAVADIHESFLDNAQYEEVVRLHEVFFPYLKERAGGATAPEYDALIERTLDSQVLHQLAARVEEGKVSEEVAGAYYRTFGHGRLRSLLAHCGDLKKLCQWPTLAEAMVDIARADSAALRSCVAADDPTVAYAAAYLVGLMADGAFLEQLARALETGDDAVRREALLAVKQIGGGRALEVIARKIDDPDPTIRFYALRHLISQRYFPALARVRALLDQRAARRSPTERRLLYEAYGALGGRDVVEDLGRRLKRRDGLWRKVDHQEQACVLVALGAVGTPDARTLVEEAAGARHPLVQRTAVEILRAWESGGAQRA